MSLKAGIHQIRITIICQVCFQNHESILTNNLETKGMYHELNTAVNCNDNNFHRVFQDFDSLTDTLEILKPIKVRSNHFMIQITITYQWSS